MKKNKAFYEMDLFELDLKKKRTKLFEKYIMAMLIFNGALLVISFIAESLFTVLLAASGAILCMCAYNNSDQYTNWINYYIYQKKKDRWTEK